jgi:hypothetical protein
MLRRTLVALFVATIAAGCASTGTSPKANAASASGNAHAGMDPPAEAMSDTQLAAYAGNAKFPTTQPENSARVAAIVSADRRTIKIYNFENQPLRAVNLWVNGAYVQPIQGIPAHGRTILRTDKLFNGLGDTFAKRAEEVTRVQLETKDGLYTLLGPATE